MSELEKTRVGGDLIQHEGNAGVTRESKTVANGTAADWSLPAGYPIDDNVAVVAANIANVDGLLLTATDIPAGESRKVPVLARGPSAINADALPTVDYLDAAINATNFETAIAALGIVVRDQPSTVEEQTE